MAIWDDIIPEEEREAYRKAGWGGTIGFGKRPAIVVVDMNKAFVDQNYPFSSPAAIPAVEKIKDILIIARQKKVPIVYTTLAKIHNKAELGYWKADALIDPIVNEGDGRDIYPMIAPQEGETVIEKYYPSGFFGTNLSSLLNYYKTDTVIVTGTVTCGCVRATVLDAFNHNYRVIVPQECVCDRGEVSHKVALFEFHMKYADVVDTQLVHDYLEKIVYNPL